MTTRRLAAALVGAVLAFAAVAPAAGQPAADAAAAPAGSYELDPRHTAVLARVSHFGFSYEVFRFGDVSGTLTWDPANPGANRLNATVRTASIATPVEGFAEELRGERFLNVAQHPEARFEATAFRQLDAAHGQIDGNLTLLGVTKPVTFDTTLIGAGANNRGVNMLGVHAVASINGAEFGAPAIANNGPIHLVIDAEFRKAAQ